MDTSKLSISIVNSDGSTFSGASLLNITRGISKNVLILQYNFIQDIQKGTIELTIFDKSIFQDSKNQVYNIGEKISIGNVYRNVSDPYEKRQMFEYLEIATNVLFGFIMFLFLTGFYE